MNSSASPDTSAHWRIGRVKLKSGGATVEVLRTPPPPSRLAESLVGVLASAREGRVEAYAVIFRVIEEGGGRVWHRAWAISPSDDFHHEGCALLGNMEMVAAQLRKELRKC